MMKALLVVSVACLFAVTAVRAQTYPAEYDSLDIDALLNNEDKVIAFGVCLLDDTVCTERALKLKDILLDAFRTKCSKCTENQRRQLSRAMQYIKRSPPEQWHQLLQTYDPEGTRTEEFVQILQKA